MTFPKPFFKWRPHPWHGLEPGLDPPRIVSVYIEITPFDSVKYEVDKVTGYLRVDRPQRTSSQPPSLYGFIPRTYCGERVAKLSPKSKAGDGDPLDICVISERPVNRAEIIVHSKVIGGLQMVDEGKADDKIIAVLENDYEMGAAEKLSDIPNIIVERLRHYFSTYKYIIGKDLNQSIERVYDYDHALKVVDAAMKDYLDEFGQ